MRFALFWTWRRPNENSTEKILHRSEAGNVCARQDIGQNCYWQRRCVLGMDRIQNPSGLSENVVARSNVHGLPSADDAQARKDIKENCVDAQLRQPQMRQSKSHLHWECRRQHEAGR